MSEPSHPPSFEDLRAMQASPTEMHGNLGLAMQWAAPRCVTEVGINARRAFTDVKADEWYDHPEVLISKVKLLAAMIARSANMLVFTGAGISVAAGIDDYATKASTTSHAVSVTEQGKQKLSGGTVAQCLKARPTITHRALTSMYHSGLLKHWIQQNHDSLPQKAGCPQHALNEIHGSLHDPSNPIIPIEGELRDDLHKSMESWKAKSDLCLAVGTSLSGFTADDVVVQAADKQEQGSGQGLVIMNLQQTPYDHRAALRIYAKCDDIMKMLIEELALEVLPMDSIRAGNAAEGSMLEPDVYSIPFGLDGWPSEEKCVWDLRNRRRIRLTGGPFEGDHGTIVGKDEDGHYKVHFKDCVHPQFRGKGEAGAGSNRFKCAPFTMRLGVWIVDDATNGFGIVPGGPIPFVNVRDSRGEVEVEPERTATSAVSAVNMATYKIKGLGVNPRHVHKGGKGKGKGKGKCVD